MSDPQHKVSDDIAFEVFQSVFLEAAIKSNLDYKRLLDDQHKLYAQTRHLCVHVLHHGYDWRLCHRFSRAFSYVLIAKWLERDHSTLVKNAGRTRKRLEADTRAQSLVDYLIKYRDEALDDLLREEYDQAA